MVCDLDGGFAGEVIEFGVFGVVVGGLDLQGLTGEPVDALGTVEGLLSIITIVG